MQPWCMGISTLLLSALLPWPGAGQFYAVGPGAPVIASVGEEAVLSCHLSPETDAEDMEVTWKRMDPPALVHHYAASEDQHWQQNPQFQGRTEFLKENINTGQVALRIHPILPSDGGEYRCNFASSTFESEAQVEVLVTDAMFSRLWPWIVRFAVPLCLLAVTAAFGVLFIRTRRKRGSLQIEHGSLRREYAQSIALGAEGPSVIRKFGANVTLDRDTAHPHLKVSEDRKCVKHVDEKRDVPANPERFDTLRAVLGENSFSAGDHY